MHLLMLIRGTGVVFCATGDMNAAEGYRLFFTPASPLGYWLPVCRACQPDDLGQAA